MVYPHTIIENTPIGTMVGGVLGDSNMIKSRYNKIRSLMVTDVTRASVGACSILDNPPSSTFFQHKNTLDTKNSKIDTVNEFANENTSSEPLVFPSSHIEFHGSDPPLNLNQFFS